MADSKRKPVTSKTTPSYDCPKCGNPLVMKKEPGRIASVCPTCQWEGPSVTPSGIVSTDENYQD